jgi:hypothetical protein
MMGKAGTHALASLSFRPSAVAPESITTALPPHSPVFMDCGLALTRATE